MQRARPRAFACTCTSESTRHAEPWSGQKHTSILFNVDNLPESADQAVTICLFVASAGEHPNTADVSYNAPINTES